MSALFSDWRKAALGALALLLFTLMFTDRGGLGETAVNNVQELAARDRALHPQPARPAANAWFAADESQYEVFAAPSASRRAALPAFDGGSRPAPTGPDFPAGLRPPA